MKFENEHNEINTNKRITQIIRNAAENMAQEKPDKLSLKTKELLGAVMT